jgi:hypothetical protein
MRSARTHSLGHAAVAAIVVATALLVAMLLI